MIVDGRAIAAAIYAEVKEQLQGEPQRPKLAVITCAPSPETKQYLELKRRKAAAVGIPLLIIELPETATTVETITTIQRIATEADGIVVQLPLPAHIDREAVLAAVPADKDPDAFSYVGARLPVLPPVVAAIKEIAKQHDIDWVGKKVVVVGHGRLVGQPAMRFATEMGANVTLITEETADPATVLSTADIIISGVGKPHFITAEQVKEGVVIFDAGASEDGGEIVGDVHPDVQTKAALFTPVPGGIGPITVAVLLRNLIILSRG